MKSYGGVWERIVSPETLHESMRLAARGKRDRLSVQRFLRNAHNEIDVLRAELIDGQYRPKPYTQFRIRDPKPRTITCADFRDRIVHHALCDVCGPVLERRFIDDSFACRRGKGTHRAVERAQRFCRRYPYYLKVDIRSFYDSVQIGQALKLVQQHFRETEVRKLWAVVLQHPFPGQPSGIGLPIGNLTSQWTANIYLDALDHLIKETWRFKGYVRYMDDSVLWAESRGDLRWVHGEMQRWLETHRGLQLKTEATRLASVREGVPFLGMRIFPGGLRLQRQRYLRLRRLVQLRERMWKQYAIDDDELVSSFMAAGGILRRWGLKSLTRVEVDV